MDSGLIHREMDIVDIVDVVVYGEKMECGVYVREGVDGLRQKPI